MTEEEPPGLSELDGPPAPGPLDQALAEQGFQGRDVIADRRERAAQLLRGCPESARFGNRAQGVKMLELDAPPIVRNCDILPGKLLLLRTFKLGTL
jgi:hypothetical protein